MNRARSTVLGFRLGGWGSSHGGYILVKTWRAGGNKPQEYLGGTFWKRTTSSAKALRLEGAWPRGATAVSLQVDTSGQHQSLTPLLRIPVLRCQLKGTPSSKSHRGNHACPPSAYWILSFGRFCYESVLGYSCSGLLKPWGCTVCTHTLTHAHTSLEKQSSSWWRDSSADVQTGDG